MYYMSSIKKRALLLTILGLLIVILLGGILYHTSSIMAQMNEKMETITNIQSDLNKKIVEVEATQNDINEKILRLESIKDDLNKKIEELQNIQRGLEEATAKNEEDPQIETTLVDPDVVEKDKIVATYDTEAKYIAKTVWAEARGCSKTEQAAVIWCILNRVDNRPSNTIIDIITASGQFAYRENSPVTDELYDLAIDVLTRWEEEKYGKTDVGRVLPKEYMWFRGDGTHNHFRDAFRNGNEWDWSLKSPYE